MLRLINGAGYGKVDSGLKMLIEPIKFWQVASKYYRKIFESIFFFRLVL